MSPTALPLQDVLPPDSWCYVKSAGAVILLAAFWCWETLWPYFGNREGRLRHAARNLSLALVNTALLALVFGSITVFVANWAQERRFGLLHSFALNGPVRLALGIVLLDAWMYVWHRANHAIPLLWRFHRMHHSDTHMDVTTATRFHLGEHVGAATLRLGVVGLLGIEVWTLVLYETLVLAVTQFHHADISLSRVDRWLRWLIVTPDIHKVHHSDWRPETDSNYSTVLSVWDRLAGTLRLRANPKSIHFGLEEFADPGWQRWWGMWKTPFVDPAAHPHEPTPIEQPAVVISSPHERHDHVSARS